MTLTDLTVAGSAVGVVLSVIALGRQYALWVNAFGDINRSLKHLIDRETESDQRLKRLENGLNGVLTRLAVMEDRIGRPHTERGEGS